MKNRCTLFFTDESLVNAMNKQSCKDNQLMIYVRKLVLTCLKHNIVFKAKHVPGSKSRPADSLSCLQLEKFFQSAPSTMAQSATKSILHLLWHNWRLECLLNYNPTCNHHRSPPIRGHGSFFTNFYRPQCLFLLQTWHSLLPISTKKGMLDLLSIHMYHFYDIVTTCLIF